MSKRERVFGVYIGESWPTLEGIQQNNGLTKKKQIMVTMIGISKKYRKYSVYVNMGVWMCVCLFVGNENFETF